MKITTIIWKMVCFLAFFSTIVLFMKQVDPYGQELPSIINKVEQAKDSSIFFVGSSRVMAGVDPHVIESGTGRNTQNLAVAGSTFLASCIMADYLLDKDGSKTIFLELSPIRYELPKGLISFANGADFDVIQSSFQFASDATIMDKTNMISQIGIQKISILEESKWLLRDLYYPLKNQESRKSFLLGYHPISRNNHQSIDPFLKLEDFNIQGSTSPFYDHYLNILNLKARRTNSKVVCMLPITYRLEAEKNLTIPYFMSLSAGSKLVYPESLLSQITNPKYLRDINHLNTLGAKTYSRLLSSEIIRQGH